jgi:hypothetical protein
VARAAAGMSADPHAARAAELAAAMAAAAARLPRDWPKELRPANPAGTEEKQNGRTEG